MRLSIFRVGLYVRFCVCYYIMIWIPSVFIFDISRSIRPKLWKKNEIAGNYKLYLLEEELQIGLSKRYGTKCWCTRTHLINSGHLIETNIEWVGHKLKYRSKYSVFKIGTILCGNETPTQAAKCAAPCTRKQAETRKWKK